MKKKTTKKVKKVVKKVATEVKTEDADYWKNRPLDDKRRDWGEKGENWIEDYKLSINHPHRQLILQALDKFGTFAGLLEVGCGVGANLKLIQDKYPETQMAGVDVNDNCIEEAKKFVPKAILKVGEATSLPFDDKSFDCILFDAVLIYINPSEISKVISEIDRVVRKFIVLCEWFDEDSTEGIIKDFHWCRNYEKILNNLGYRVERIKITEENWPSKKWVIHGNIFVGIKDNAIPKRTQIFQNEAKL